MKQNQEGLHNKTAIRIFACISFILSIPCFYFNGGFRIFQVGNVQSLVGLVASALLVLYVMGFRRRRSSVLVAIAIALFCLPVIRGLLMMIEPLSMGMWDYYAKSIILDVLELATVLIGTIGVVFGWKTKACVMIAAAGFLPGIVMDLWLSFSYGISLDTILNLRNLFTLFEICIAVTLFLLVLTNEIPAVVKRKKEEPILSPEIQLRVLQEQWEQGKILEEEYRAKRTEIIQKL